MLNNDYNNGPMVNLVIKALFQKYNLKELTMLPTTLRKLSQMLKMRRKGLNAR